MKCHRVTLRNQTWPIFFFVFRGFWENEFISKCVNSLIMHLSIMTSRQTPEWILFFLMFLCSTKYDSSHGNKQQKWSKEKSKSDLFNLILNQQRHNSWDSEDNETGRKWRERLEKHNERQAEYRTKQEMITETTATTRTSRHDVQQTYFCILCTSVVTPDCGPPWSHSPAPPPGLIKKPF